MQAMAVIKHLDVMDYITSGIRTDQKVCKFLNRRMLPNAFSVIIYAASHVLCHSFLDSQEDA